MIEGKFEELKPQEGDELIKCKEYDCPLGVVFTKKDKEYFDSQGWDGKPARCKKHRQEARQRREQDKNRQ